MAEKDDDSTIYHAIAWMKEGDRPGDRVTVVARNGDDAKKQLKEKYGTDMIVSLWNEEDANTDSSPQHRTGR